MGSASLAELSQIELGNALVEAAERIKMPLSTDQLIASLENANSLLAQVWQRPPRPTCMSLVPIMKAMISDELLHHPDVNVQVTLASCFADIARISAPDPSFCDDTMREVFRLLMVAFRQLLSESGRNYLKALDVLKTVEQVKLPLLLLDIGPQERIYEMFQIFLDSIRSTHPPDVFKHMETIMTMVIKESDRISFEMLRPLLHSIRMESKGASPSSWELGLKVFEICAAELRHSLKQSVKLKKLDVYDYAKIVSSICQNKFNKVSVKPDARAGDVDESDGKEFAQSKEDAGALSTNKGRQHSKVKELESSSTLKPKKMQDKTKGSRDSKKSSKTEATGSSIGKGKKRRLPHDNDLEETDKLLHRVKKLAGNEDIRATMSQKHVSKDVSDQKGDTRPGTVEQKRKGNKTRKLKKSRAGELINARIKVWWPMDKRFYIGTVVDFDSAVKKHKIVYDDGEEEILKLRDETWEFVDDELPLAKQETDRTSPAKKAARTEEKVVKKKKTLLKKQLGTSSSKESKNEGQIIIIGKSGKNREAQETNTSMMEVDRISEDVTNP